MPSKAAESAAVAASSSMVPPAGGADWHTPSRSSAPPGGDPPAPPGGAPPAPSLPDSPACRRALALAAELRRSGHQAYFVGGAPRDLLLGRPAHDIDIATSATPEQVAAIFPDTFEVGASFGVSMVVLEAQVFEVATLREERGYADGRHPGEVRYTDSPEVDARRRDFTINALFLDPETGALLDFVDGVGDLRRGVLRTVGDPEKRFAEDYLRMLRAARFATRFGFALDPAAAAVIGRRRGDLLKISAERVRDEFDKMLCAPRPGAAFRLLHQLAMLETLLPEVAMQDGVRQPEQFHPEGDVLEHTMLMLDRMGAPDVELGWAALLHDVGKRECYSEDAAGVPHFYGHESRGAAIAEDIMRRLKFPRRRLERVATAIGGHMRVSHSPMMRQSKLRRLLAAETFPLELELHRVDCACSHRRFDCHTHLLDAFAALGAEPTLPPPLITGGDLIALGMKPGPKFGEILVEVANQQLEGYLNSRDAALEWIKRQYLAPSA